eukprot:gb/GECH01003943.1/.p1 GENE.gb/GECH01003943.1/~~gb/GECH01003943.1/.p1  ORF type:complete len:490 (+),score=159.39 gb/GECH01003943.1/:1-1470(+)
MQSTFTLKGRHAKKKYPSGTKPSVHNGQLLVSTGLNDLDGIIGGGIPLGTIILLKEDTRSQYAQYLFRYFLSEGLHSSHSVCACYDASLPLQRYPKDIEKQKQQQQNDDLSEQSAQQQTIEEDENENDPMKFIPTLPFVSADTKAGTSKSKKSQKVSSSSSSKHRGSEPLIASKNTSSSSPTKKTTAAHDPKDSLTTSDGLKIAWRYQKYVDESKKKATQQRGHGTVPCHHYDISRALQKDVIDKIRDDIEKTNRVQEIDVLSLASHLDPKLENNTSNKSNNDNDNNTDELLKSIYHSIKDSVRRSLQVLNEAVDHKVLRVGIQSFGSLTYGDPDEQSIVQFMHSLRGLMRTSLGVCMITVPKNTMDEDLVRKMENMSDIVLNMDSFVGAEMDVSEFEFKEYTGLFHIEKLPRLNSMTVGFAPDLLHYAFKMHRRRMAIDTMHMPPEESRVASEADKERSRFQNPQQAESASTGAAPIANTSNSSLLEF